MSVLRLIMSSYPYPRLAKARFPLQNLQNSYYSDEQCIKKPKLILLIVSPGTSLMSPDNLLSRPHLMNRRIYPALKILNEKYPTQFCEAFQRMNFER